MMDEVSADLQFLRCPSFLMDIGGTQRLRFGIYEPALPTQKPSLEIHCAGYEVRDIYRMRLCTFDMSVRVIEPALVEK